MNERIGKLAEQAGSTHKQNLGVYQFYTDELEKFAELIVRECAQDFDNTYMSGGKTMGAYIREKFGVEK